MNTLKNVEVSYFLIELNQIILELMSGCEALFYIPKRACMYIPHRRMDALQQFQGSTVRWFGCSQQIRLMTERHKDAAAARHRAIVMVTKHLPVNWNLFSCHSYTWSQIGKQSKRELKFNTADIQVLKKSKL